MITSFTYAYATYRGVSGFNKPVPGTRYLIGLSPLPNPDYMLVGVERGPNTLNSTFDKFQYSEQEAFWRDWEDVLDKGDRPIKL